MVAFSRSAGRAEMDSRREVHMYENREIILRLSSFEVQQALYIWLDDDGHEALRFIKEKIVAKTARPTCKRAESVMTAPCLLTESNCACCRAGAAGSKGAMVAVAAVGKSMTPGDVSRTVSSEQ
jgi:hypothetical protein